MTEKVRRELGVELEAALVRELLAEYQRINYSHFKRRLQPPAIALSDAKSRFGRYDAEARVLEISRALVLQENWIFVLEVLKHEMAHQYVLEILGASETAHGPAFVDLCAQLGIDARASGFPDAPSEGPGISEGGGRVLERVARLLALAESDNPNEAEAAMKAAQRLMLKYNLEVGQSGGRSAGYAYRTLGKPSGRVTEGERALGTILSEFFFVEVIWVPAYRVRDGKRGSVMEVCGSAENLEMAAYVHSFLAHACDRLWKDHQERQGIRDNRERRTFAAGVMAGFYGKLKRERSAQQQEGLVWVGDADLHRYYRKRHPHVATVRYGGQPRTATHAHGRVAGQKLVLHKPVGASSSGQVRLLKS